MEQSNVDRTRTQKAQLALPNGTRSPSRDKRVHSQQLGSDI
jgi:hypothetical protein